MYISSSNLTFIHQYYLNSLSQFENIILGINTIKINTREQCPLEGTICMTRMVEQANQCTINR